LDSLTENIRCPCFIKMDVDGAETEILAGASVINALPDIRWLIETHSEKLERGARLFRNSAQFDIITGSLHGRVAQSERPTSNYKSKFCRIALQRCLAF